MTGEVEFQNHFAINDNKEIRVGSGNDLRIYHDASNSYIKDIGDGQLRIGGSSVKIYGGADFGETCAEFIDNGSVDLYYDNSKTFETTSYGASVTGNLAVSGTVDGVDIAARDAILTSTTTTAGAALPKAGGAMTGAITTNSTFDGRDVATDGTKLDNIEANADVTDATNVAAALPNGVAALTSGEVTQLANIGTAAISATEWGYVASATAAFTSTYASNIATNNAKVTNATHTGEVTGSGALTIASNVVDADNLKVTGNGTTSQYLRSDGDGTFTWDTPTDTNTTYVSSDFTHDDLTGFVANEHIDWTTDQGGTNIHAGNYTDTNTTYVSSDFTHDNLTGFVANEHIDWTTDQGGTNIHAGNYTDTNTTYVSSDFTHDNLTGFVANEHIDWTTDQGGTNIHAGNYTDTNTTYSVGDGGLTEINFTSADNTKLDGIEASADVTDATNVAAALTNGVAALTASEVTQLAKIGTESISGAEWGYVANSTASFTSTLETTINGATQDTDSDVSTNTWVLDEDDFSSDSATKVPTQQSVKAYVAANGGGGGGSTDHLAVGTYHGLYAFTSGDRDIGATLAGSSLRYYNAGSAPNSNGWGTSISSTSNTSTVSGTWRNMSTRNWKAQTGRGGNTYYAGLWVRIS